MCLPTHPVAPARAARPCQPRVTPAVAAALAAMLSLGAGCAPRPRTAVSVGADVSFSFGPTARAEGAAMLEAAATRSFPAAGADARVWLFSQRADADPVFESRVRSAGDLRRFTGWYVREAGTGGAPGTYAAPVLRRFLEDARKADAAGGRTTLALILVTDGGFDDLPEVAKLAAQLARCRSVAAVWVGPVSLDRGVRAGVERAFAPLRDGGRLIVTNRLDAPAGPARFRDALRKGPRP